MPCHFSGRGKRDLEAIVQDFAKMTNNKVKIVTTKDKTEKYGRYLAEVFALEGSFKDKSLNEEMLTFGFASEYNQ